MAKTAFNLPGIVAVAFALFHLALGSFGTAGRDNSPEKVSISGMRWCWQVGQNGECTYADTVYPTQELHSWPGYWQRWSMGQFSLGLEHNYQINWTPLGDEKHRVVFRWLVADNVTLEKEIPPGSSMYDFSFKKLAAEFPTKEHNLTPELVEAMANSASSYIYIDQPGNKNVFPVGLGPFAVFDRSTSRYVGSEQGWQRRQGNSEMYNKWKLGVGFGVGIGVPIIMVGTFMAGRAFGKRQGRIQLD